jgi:hypothetical protein
MKHRVNLHGIWKFELECHYVDLFHDGKCTKSLIVHFFQWWSCFDVLLLKLNLVFDLEIWLVFTMFIGIFLLSFLNFLKVRYKLCSNVC